MPKRFNRLIEPFSGMAAISVAVAQTRKTDFYYINDLNAPLVNMLRTAVNEPEILIKKYSTLWNKQFDYGENHVQHFYDIREQFNNGDKSPENMLYLLARCVKGAVRYNSEGKFNQSPDKRRHGTNPRNIEINVHAISHLLKRRSEFSALDYREIFEMAQPGDLIYMDPPYQGVSNTRDNRYFSGVPFAEFVSALESLNKKNVDFLISYDGVCGEKEYGKDLPDELECRKILLDAGISSQATLLGRKATTYEALYMSRNIQSHEVFIHRQMELMEAVGQ
jgi:DNA adenine methylase